MGSGGLFWDFGEGGRRFKAEAWKDAPDIQAGGFFKGGHTWENTTGPWFSESGGLYRFGAGFGNLEVSRLTDTAQNCPQRPFTGP
jgi:hypothetical protein